MGKGASRDKTLISLSADESEKHDSSRLLERDFGRGIIALDAGLREVGFSFGAFYNLFGSVRNRFVGN
jgi:hypothetical protein